MIVLGVTGSIGMGKSEASRMLRRLGVPVFESDAAVHAMTGPGGDAVAAIADAFPEVVRGGAVDRARLGARVFGDADALAQLESILHPRVYASQRAFLARLAARRRPIAALDIPLLFETGGERKVDAVAVVSAPARIQRRRVLARRGMTEERLDEILARQMPDREKRRLADYVLPTGLGKRVMYRAICRMLAQARLRTGDAWPWPVRKPGGENYIGLRG